ncbi:hypothetical protein AABB24_022639 [Solanum stoloniferum]|uniref:Uncharacterized protein n=1 Tax=Solanum stoloniferum TaxID=62892 RepID=A0ABD2T0B1_9SOLN
MAKKNCLVTIVICIFLLVNLAFASEISDSSSNDETAQAKGLDSYFPWIQYTRPWLFPRPWPYVYGGFHPHQWPFVLPQTPTGFFRPRFPYLWAYRFPWSFVYPPAPSPPKGDEEAGKN